MWLSKHFTDFAAYVATASGRPFTLLVFIWGITGPLFGFSNTWQLVINTGTTIVTFLMVFLIQNTQNRDGAAIQVKLDELIRTSSARNGYMGIERLTAEELEEVRKLCEERAGRAGKGERATRKAQGSVTGKASEAAERVTS
jgi:low affinity Fe/Cu permease